MVRWKIAVTTAPRHPNFLDQTLTSLCESGWNYTDLQVNAEPSSASSVLPVREYINGSLAGPWRNWRQALADLITKECEYLAIVQDDLIFRPGLRQYLDETMLDRAVYSPYLSKKDAASLGAVKEGWHQCKTGWAMCGACFFAMGRTLAVELLNHLPANVPENKHIDAVLANLLKNLHIPLYVHSPSLVQHLADEHSTLGYGKNPYCRTGYGYTEEPLNGDA